MYFWSFLCKGCKCTGS